MYYVVYRTRGGVLSVRDMQTRYEDVALSIVAQIRAQHQWQAYRLFFDDGEGALCVARWGVMTPPR